MYLKTFWNASSLSILLSLLVWQCSSSTAAESPDEPNGEMVAASVSTTPPRRYTTVTVSPSTQRTSLRINGRTQALEVLQVVAEVAGQTESTNKLLNEGVSYQKGETLIQIEDDRYRLSLQAQRSQFHASLVRIMSQIQLDYPTAHAAWDGYLRSFDEQALLPELPDVTDEQLRFFLSANNVYSTYYNIKSAEEMLPKYRIQAPFSGVITQGSVAPGSVVAAGVPLATFSRTDIYELKAAVSSAQVQLLKVGQKLELTHRNTNQTWTGTVQRIGQTIDPGTQAIPVFISVSGRNLRVGMFLEASLQSDSYEQVVALPTEAINRNNQVHRIEDGVVVLQDVTPVHYADNEVWVRGLEKGQVIIIESTIEPIVGTKAIAK